MKVGILGSGDVGKVLAAGFLKHGHEVVMGVRTSEKVAEWGQKNPGCRIGSFSDAAKFAEVIVLAINATAAAEVLRAIGAADLAGKIVIDPTNPISDEPPVNGVVKYFTDLNQSLMERFQQEFEKVRFVKAFSCIGSPWMVNPEFKGGPPTMFICGNDDEAKEIVTGILTQFGWETADLGKVEAARAIEPLCIILCIPGLLRNDWVHALKLL
jgi:predicted dinucleotide-binding enzyme